MNNKLFITTEMNTDYDTFWVPDRSVFLDFYRNAYYPWKAAHPEQNEGEITKNITDTWYKMSSNEQIEYMLGTRQMMK